MLKKQNFIKGSVILMVSAAAAKMLGAFFKIPLTNILGGVGMSYFSCAYSLFMPIYALIVTGISSASARMTARSAASGNLAEARMIRRTALLLFTAVGLAGSALIFLLAKPFSVISAGSPDAQAAVAMIAPSVLFGCITAVERGYFEGMSNMYPTAVSQVIEGAVKVAAGLKLCGYVTEHPETVLRFFPEVTDIRGAAAAAGIMGVTLSSMGAAVFFGVIRLFSRESVTKMPMMSRKSAARELMAEALPIGISAVVTNLTALIDMWTMIGCISPDTVAHLPDGINRADVPNFVYGSFAGIALTVFNLVPSVTNSLGKGALTCVTSAYERGDRQSLHNSTVQALVVTAVIAVPSAVGLGILSEQVLTVLFSHQPDEVAVCVRPLRLLMPAMVCLCLSCPLFSMLQAIGKAAAPLKIMLMGTAVKLLGNLCLVPKMGADGAAISTAVCYGAILAVSLTAYLKGAEISLSIKPFVKIVYAGGLCGGIAYLTASIIERGGGEGIAVIMGAAMMGGVVYVSSLYAMMGVRKKKKQNIKRKNKKSGAAA